MTKVTSVKTTLAILGCLGVLAWGLFQALYAALAPLFNTFAHGGSLK